LHLNIVNLWIFDRSWSHRFVQPFGRWVFTCY
jgi:hypothetical protein